MALTPEQRSERARIAAHAMHAKHDPEKTTRAAHERANNLRFLDEVDPTGELRRERPEEAQRRAESARRAYMARIRFEWLKKSQKPQAAA